MILFSDEHKAWAMENYLEMKHRAGVSLGKEFLLIKDGQFVPCSKEEYLSLQEKKEPYEVSCSHSGQ